jgi:hypothetical protein
MLGQVFIAIRCVGKLTVKTALPENGVDEPRNASENYLKNVTSSMRSGVLNVATAKTGNTFYCYFQSIPRSSKWSLSLRFSTETLYVPLVSPIHATRPVYPHPIHLNMWLGLFYSPVTFYLLAQISSSSPYSLRVTDQVLYLQEHKKQHCSSGYFTLYIFGRHIVESVERMIIMTKHLFKLFIIICPP